jgi:ankyrin repeat protein
MQVRTQGLAVFAEFSSPAIFAQDAASVRLLLQRGVPITGIVSRDRFGAPPLVFAAQHGMCQGRLLVLLTMSPGTVEIVELLLAAGATHADRDSAGRTAVMRSLHNDDLGVFQRLLKASGYQALLETDLYNSVTTSCSLTSRQSRAKCSDVRNLVGRPARRAGGAECPLGSLGCHSASRSGFFDCCSLVTVVPCCPCCHLSYCVGPGT